MNVVTLLILVAPVVFVLVIVRKRSQRSRIRAATVSIQADREGVRRTLADGRTEEVHWHEVREVDAFRTRVGPHKPAGGGVVLYGTEDRGCIIPFDKLEESSLLVHINHLPGFDVGALITFVGADPGSVPGSDSTLALLSPKPLQTTETLWTRPEPDPDPDDDDGDEVEGEGEDELPDPATTEPEAGEPADDEDEDDEEDDRG